MICKDRMMKKPFVTVLMPVYNGGEYLKTSVRSVLNQTYREFEFLIINDCSTDNSVEIIKSFNDERIVIHNNKTNLGQTKSLNVGLKLARGKYVARMDADDMAFPQWIERTFVYINKHPDYAAVGTWAVVIDGTGRKKKLLKTPIGFEGVLFHIFFGNAINHVGAILNKEIILRHGGYDEKFRIAQDYELWSSLIRNNYCIISIPEILVSVRVHENSLGFMEEKNKGLHEVAQTIHRNINNLAGLKISLEDAVKMRMFYRYPDQMTDEDFKNIFELYIKVFINLKEKFRFDTELLGAKLKRQMLTPFCKRAISEILNGRPKNARKIIFDYDRQFGFHFILSLISFMSFLGKPAVKKMPLIYEMLQETAARINTRR